MDRAEALSLEYEVRYVLLSGKHKQAVDVAFDALREQESKVVEIDQFEPLTIEELRNMDGEPVFIEDLVHKEDPDVPDLWGGWIVFLSHNQAGFIPRGGGFFFYEGYGKTWLAYRKPPMESLGNGKQATSDKSKQQSDGWISVKDRLPEEKVDVLMYFKEGNMAVGYLCDRDEHLTFWCAYTDGGYFTDCDSTPTYWMPRPKPPIKGEE